MPGTKYLLIIPLLLLGTLLFAQTRTITGKVMSLIDDTPVSGATISVKGTTQGVTTRADGSFSIPASTGRVTLQLSSIGFELKEVIVDPGQDIVRLILRKVLAIERSSSYSFGYIKRSRRVGMQFQPLVENN